MKKRVAEISVGVFLLIALAILLIRMSVKYNSSFEIVKAFLPWFLVSIGVYMAIVHLMQKDNGHRTKK